ncbi:hypothetical protein QQ045_000773 [Rhodiola kirilowii]
MEKSTFTNVLWILIHFTKTNHHTRTANLHKSSELTLTMATPALSGSPEKSYQEEPSWANVDIYILLKILCRIPLNDLSWNVSFVCVPWQKASYELLFWNQNKLDLRIASPSCSRCNKFGAKSSNLFDLGLSSGGPSLPLEDAATMDFKMMRLLRGVLNGGDGEWQTGIYAIYVPCDLQISDQHLIYIISERTPNAEVLVIEKATNITPGGLSAALSHLRHIGQIDIQLIQYDLYEEMLEVISISRGHLSGVRLMTTAGDYSRGRPTKYYGW